MTLLQAMRASNASGAARRRIASSSATRSCTTANIGQASQAYTAVLSGRDAVTVDSLVRWAHHGLALDRRLQWAAWIVRSSPLRRGAREGRDHSPTRSRCSFSRRNTTRRIKAIDRFAAARRDENAMQFVTGSAV